MIYDPVADRVIVFGGLGGPGYMNDVWQLSLSGTPTWTHLAISGTPPIGRYGHSAIYDPLRLRMVVFGGYDGASNKLFNDVWALDLMSLTWSPMTVSGTLPLSATPIARDFTAMAYDAAHDRIVMHGGNRETLTPNGAFIGQTQVGGDLWMLDLEDLHTPVLVSTVESEAGPDLVRLRWHVSELDRSFDVMRSGSDGGWRARASLRPGSGGFLSYEDTDIQPGATYSYRLQFEDEGSVRYAGETRIEVPVESSLRLDAAPLIDGGRFAVELTLPKASAAHLAVYDVSGRRVAEHDTPTLAAGRHVIDFGATTGWGPGVYWVRLEGAASMLQRRVVLIR
jgi:hypothetical protein